MTKCFLATLLIGAIRKVNGDVTNTYSQARGEVAAWVGKHGNAAVNSLLSAVSGGQNFYTVYGPMQTQYFFQK
jgi:hypothetical protein